MTNEIIQKSTPSLGISRNQLEAYRENDKSNPDATHFVLWSGGCDSTLLLYELLETYGPEKVVAVSCKYPWLYGSKKRSEKLHREAFKSLLDTRNKKYRKINHIELSIYNDITGKYRQRRLGGLPQAVAWMLAVPLFASANSFIYNGAIKSDDLIINLDGYHQMFNGIAKTLNSNIYLREPYIYYTKAQILEKLFHYNLYDSTWFCEIPLEPMVPCYNCQPCKTHIAALTELSLGKKDDFVTMMATRELDKIRNAIIIRNDISKES